VEPTKANPEFHRPFRKPYDVDKKLKNSGCDDIICASFFVSNPMDSTYKGQLALVHVLGRRAQIFRLQLTLNSKLFA
jgi:hypothetical protein